MRLTFAKVFNANSWSHNTINDEWRSHWYLSYTLRSVPAYVFDKTCRSKVGIACDDTIRRAVGPVGMSCMSYHDLTAVSAAHQRSSYQHYRRLGRCPNRATRQPSPMDSDAELESLVTFSNLCSEIPAGSSLYCMRWLMKNEIVHLLLTRECRNLTTLRLYGAPFWKQALSRVGFTWYFCYSIGQFPEWMQLFLSELLWKSVSRVMGVKTLEPELRIGCPWHTHELDRSLWFLLYLL